MERFKEQRIVRLVAQLYMPLKQISNTVVLHIAQVAV